MAPRKGRDPRKEYAADIQAAVAGANDRNWLSGDGPVWKPPRVAQGSVASVADVEESLSQFAIGVSIESQDVVDLQQEPVSADKVKIEAEANDERQVEQAVAEESKPDVEVPDIQDMQDEVLQHDDPEVEQEQEDIQVQSDEDAHVSGEDPVEVPEGRASEDDPVTHEEPTVSSEQPEDVSAPEAGESFQYSINLPELPEDNEEPELDVPESDSGEEDLSSQFDTSSMPPPGQDESPVMVGISGYSPPLDDSVDQPSPAPSDEEDVAAPDSGDLWQDFPLDEPKVEADGEEPFYRRSILPYGRAEDVATMDPGSMEAEDLGAGVDVPDYPEVGGDDAIDPIVVGHTAPANPDVEKALESKQSYAALQKAPSSPNAKKYKSAGQRRWDMRIRRPHKEKGPRVTDEEVNAEPFSFDQAPPGRGYGDTSHSIGGDAADVAAESYAAVDVNNNVDMQGSQMEMFGSNAQQFAENTTQVIETMSNILIDLAIRLRHVEAMLGKVQR